MTDSLIANQLPSVVACIAYSSVILLMTLLGPCFPALYSVYSNTERSAILNYFAKTNQGTQKWTLHFVLRLLIASLVSTLCCTMCAGASCNALLIANSAYPDQPLVNPKRDAVVVAQALTQKGCSIEYLFDEAKDTVISRISSITKTLTKDDMLFLYYSGHGYELHNNLHMLFPGSRNEVANDDLGGARQSLSLFDVLSLPAFESNFTLFFVVDACRTGLPLHNSDSKVSSLRRMPIVKVPINILYSTAPGAPAYDNRTRNLSLFAEVLAEQIRRSGFTIAAKEAALKNTAAIVARKSGFTQQPWISSASSRADVISSEIANSLDDLSGVAEKHSEIEPRISTITSDRRLLVMSSMSATSHEQAHLVCERENARLPKASEAKDYLSTVIKTSGIASALWLYDEDNNQNRCLMIGGRWHPSMPFDTSLVRYVPCMGGGQVRRVVCIRDSSHLSSAIELSVN